MQNGMDEILQNSSSIGGEQLCVSGDPAYIIRPWLQVVFNRQFANAVQLVHNAAMNAAREAVEWSYIDLKFILVKSRL